MTPAGEVYEGGTARYVNTGDWRTDTPVLDAEKCSQLPAVRALLPGQLPCR
ncbi:MAG: hypothetical protein ACLUNZ_03300 [Evtepia sp.]